MPHLQGMKEICTFIKRSEPTAIDWIQREGMPADKINGSWVSHTESIENWLKDRSEKTSQKTLSTKQDAKMNKKKYK